MFPCVRWPGVGLCLTGEFVDIDKLSIFPCVREDPVLDGVWLVSLEKLTNYFSIFPSVQWPSVGWCTTGEFVDIDKLYLSMFLCIFGPVLDGVWLVSFKNWTNFFVLLISSLTVFLPSLGWFCGICFFMVRGCVFTLPAMYSWLNIINNINFIHYPESGIYLQWTQQTIST